MVRDLSSISCFESGGRRKKTLYYFFFLWGVLSGCWTIAGMENNLLFWCVCVDPYCSCSSILSALNRNFFKIGAEEKFGLHSFAIQSTSIF